MPAVFVYLAVFVTAYFCYEMSAVAVSPVKLCVLQYTADGDVFIVPRNTSSSIHPCIDSHSEKCTKKRKPKKGDWRGWSKQLIISRRQASIVAAKVYSPDAHFNLPGLNLKLLCWHAAPVLQCWCTIFTTKCSSYYTRHATFIELKSIFFHLTFCINMLHLVLAMNVALDIGEKCTYIKPNQWGSVEILPSIKNIFALTT